MVIKSLSCRCCYFFIARFAAFTMAMLIPISPVLCQGIREAVGKGDLVAVKALLKENPSLVFTKHSFGLTSLHTTALTGRGAVAELLLANKADINAKDKVGRTPFHFAALTGSVEKAELLLANKADVNASNNNGEMLLQVLAFKNHDDLAKLLQQHGGHE